MPDPLIDDVRRDIGAAARQQGAFKDADTGLAKRLYALIDDDYAIDKVDWFDEGLDFIVRQPASGQRWKLRALLESDPQSVRGFRRVLVTEATARTETPRPIDINAI